MYVLPLSTAQTFFYSSAMSISQLFESTAQVAASRFAVGRLGYDLLLEQ
jgi:hypothetical protein